MYRVRWDRVLPLLGLLALPLLLRWVAINTRIGDIIHLPQSVGSPLKVMIEGQNAWLGEAGRIGQSREVKLIRQLTKE